VDRYFGPITEAVELRLGGTEPRWWLCSTQLARQPVGALFTRSSVTGAGTSIDVAEARGRAVGEAFERYSALNCSLPTISTTLREGGLLEHWPRCAPDEPCPPSLRALPADVALTHVEACGLADGRSTLVPAGFVLLSPQHSTTEPPVTLPISTGLAFHPHLHEAIWRGLCEVVERDAVMTLWWIHRTVLRIDVEGPQVPYPVAERVMRLRRAGFEPELFDITTEVTIPTVFCVLRAPRYPYVVVGAATRADAGLACAKALDEVMSMRVALQPSARDVQAKNDAVTRDDPVSAPLTDLAEHARLYARDARAPALDFLSRPGTDVIPYADFSGRSVTPPTDQDSLSQFAANLESQTAVTILWADVTCPEVAAFGSVVRVIVPELVPLSPDDNIRWLGTERLLVRSGIKDASKASFFADPHPFA
jgi:ribosomal protein S12 methylthiotransferase accessory factor